MTVKRAPIQALDKKAEQFITGGGSTAAKPEPTKDEAMVNVRLPQDVLARIDQVVKSRRVKIPRHSWLLEAIYEKLDREEGQH